MSSFDMPAVVSRRRRWIIPIAVLGLGALLPGEWDRPSSFGGASVASARSSEDARVVPAERGKILDRHGTPLAGNRQAFNVYVTPSRFDKKVRARLIVLLRLDKEQVARMDARVAHGASQPDRPILALEDQGRRRARKLIRARKKLGGAVEVHRDSYRHYPHGELAGHVLGYVNMPSGRELGAGHAASELIGHYGIERAMDSRLRGKAGTEGERGERPVAGHDVVLTLDLGLQKVAEKAVKGHTAAVAVVEVETGRILALVSTPSFDPNQMTGYLARAEHERLKNDPRKPLLDRTLQQDYPPASTFKLVTAVAGLESRLASAGEEMTCTGHRAVGSRILYDMETHGTLDLISALQRSCNVYFWKVAERVGIDRVAAVAREFGFGVPTGLDLNGDAAGVVPDKKMFGADADSNLVLTLNTAVGLGEVKATVVQLAMAYAAVANGGKLYAPQVVRKVQTASGELVQEIEPKLRRNLQVSSATLALIRKGMARAVNERGGTAVAARKGAVKMVGKTGTELERRPRDDSTIAHAWFAGWAPKDEPQIAFVVLVERGGIGGAVAAPIARDIVDAYFTRVAQRSR
jgi:penicillin-binding protein 2